jgi:hypothetical protein
MANMETYLKSWGDCVAFLNGRGSRKLGHNTYVERLAGEVFGVRYHSTYIVRYFPDGRIGLDSGGWHTVTTAQRSNACSPFSVSFSETHGGVISPNGDGAGFRDGMVSDVDGGWQEHKAATFEARKGKGLVGHYPRQPVPEWYKDAKFQGPPIRCRFTSGFLRSTVQHTGPDAPTSYGPFARGYAVPAPEFTASRMALVTWDDGNTSHVLTANLERCDR